MADDVILNLGSGGDTIAADDVGGVKYQVVKLAVGADGAANLVANANPIPVSDAGGTLTVDGSVTANAGTNLNTSALALEAGGNLAAAATSLAALDNAVAGNELQVDVLTMPTVTVNSHAVTNAGTFVTQVDGSALTALQLIDNIVVVEDAVAGSGYSGVAMLAVRQDSHSDLAADGDFISPTIDADGGLRVSIVAGAGSGGTAVADDADFTDGTTSLTPIGGVYESTPSTVTDGDIGMAGITADRSLKVHVTGITGSLTDDAAFTPGTSIASIIGGVFDDTGPDSVDEGDGGAIRMSANRNLYTTLRDAAGNERGANINASNQLAVAGPVTNAGTFVVQENGAGLTALQLIDNIVVVEDAVAGSGYSGVAMMAVRQDSQTGLAADGDFLSPTIDAAGGLRVSIVAGAGSGGTSMTDDAAFTPGTTTITPIGAMFDDVAPDSVNEGDGGVVRMSANRNLYVTLRDAAGNERGLNIDASGQLAVTVAASQTIATTNAGTFAVQNTAQASTNTQEMVGDAAHDAAAAGNPLLMGAYASAAAPSDVSGDADAVRVWALRNGSQVVNLAFGGTLVTASTVQETVGDVADDVATAGNPVLIGGVAVETDGTDPTTVSAEGDAAYLRTDRARRLLVSDAHPRMFSTSVDYASAQTNASVQAAPGAGLSLYITDLEISNGATAGNITLLDGSGGTVKFECYPAINGGAVSNRRTPIRLTANTALCITSTTVTTHSVNVGGYIAP